MFPLIILLEGPCYLVAKIKEVACTRCALLDCIDFTIRIECPILKAIAFSERRVAQVTVGEAPCFALLNRTPASGQQLNEKLYLFEQKPMYLPNLLVAIAAPGWNETASTLWRAAKSFANMIVPSFDYWFCIQAS
jgi:hypothetical protein